MEPKQAPQSPAASAGNAKRKTLGIMAILLAFVVIGIAAWLTWTAMNDRNEEETPTAAVMITTEGFVPSTVHIKKGSDVTWTNKDGNPRSLKADSEDLGLETAQPLSQGSPYSFVFDEAGSYTYHDPVNIAIKGTVIVE